ncbi:MAG: hypothetical protein KDK36_06625 [Leptospiraceae bacterium]|nr:hypothetical protein [Leptospiraceae bacterium]
MADVKGKFITLSCTLLETKPKAKEAALAKVKTLTGKNFDELDQEGWYNTSVLDAVFKSIEENSSSLLAHAAIKLIGQKVYPTIEKTAGLPKSFTNPIDFLQFEAEGFLQNHRGAEVVPRKFLKVEDKEVIVEALSPGYNPILIEGVFLGILEMCGIKTGRVIQTKSTLRGDDTCIYQITWS